MINEYKCGYELTFDGKWLWVERGVAEYLGNSRKIIIPNEWYFLELLKDFPPVFGTIYFLENPYGENMSNVELITAEETLATIPAERLTSNQRVKIKSIVDGLSPIDRVQVRLLANLSPAQRLLANIRAQRFAKAALRGTLRKRFPELSQSELNMKVLAYLTPIRMEQ
ncbi:MAG: hypothetical protein ACE5GO_02250 [Anaerolineales bacterium]